MLSTVAGESWPETNNTGFRYCGMRSAPARPPKWIIEQTQHEPDRQWPPAVTPGTAERKWSPFELRVMLLDADKSILFGRKELISQLSLHPVQYEYRTVGFLGLLPGNPVSQASDIYFMEQQADFFFSGLH